MLITYRCREYRSTVREQAENLALELGIWATIRLLHDRDARQDDIDHALWTQILRGTPGTLTAAPAALPAGVIACGPGGRRTVLPPEDIAVIEEFAALLRDPVRGA